MLEYVGSLRWDWSSMDKQYKEWLQEQTFETLAADNYNTKLLLLAEQAKNSELDATLKILKINHKLTISEFNNEQSKNKKLVEAIGNALDFIYQLEYDYEITGVLEQALNEVNNAK